MSGLQDNIMVAASGLGKRVETAAGPLDILADIELCIDAGEAVAIVGVSGSGKSTLLGLLAGLDLPSSGQVRLATHELNRLDEDGRARVRSQLVGFVFQSFQLLPGMTALENVMLPLELAGEPESRVQATRLLQRVGLGARLTHYPKQLSGGEQQRVAIARAISLFELNREHGTTLVLVTHDEALAARCDRHIRLEAGRIVNGQGRA
jgi:putative ABC transport system ATP-binding protein